MYDYEVTSLALYYEISTSNNFVVLHYIEPKADIAGKVGMRISHEKSKVMSIGTQAQNSKPINVKGQPIEDVSHLVYLGSVLMIDGGA